MQAQWTHREDIADWSQKGESMSLTPEDMIALRRLADGEKEGPEGVPTEAVQRLVGMRVARRSLERGVVGVTVLGIAAMNGGFMAQDPVERVITTSAAWLESVNLALASAPERVTWPPLASERLELLRRWFLFDCIVSAFDAVPDNASHPDLARLVEDARTVLDRASLAPTEEVQALSARGMDLWGALRAARAVERDADRTRASPAVNAAGAVGFGCRNVPQGPASALKMAASAHGAVAWVEAGGDPKAKAKARDAADRRVLRELAWALQDRIGR